MNKSVSSMSGMILTRMKSILRWIPDRLISWWRNTGPRLSQVASSYESARWYFKARWENLLERFPARRNLRALQENYWHLYDEWEKLDHDYKTVYAKYIDLLEELRYWESRHAKVLDFVEKHMEMDKPRGKK